MIPKDMVFSDVAAMAIGQGISGNLQMLAISGAVIDNGGTPAKPWHIVQKIVFTDRPKEGKPKRPGK